MAFTTLAEEATLVANLGVPVDVYATSVQGRPCRVLRFGDGPVLLLVIGGEHGNELLPRQGALDFAVWLAANQMAIPSGWSVLVAPTHNPDGVNALTRMNANGVDLNRDHVALSQPETKGLGRILGRERPLVLVDLHLGGVAENVQMAAAGHMPTTHQIVKDRNAAVLAGVLAHLNAEGFTTGWWPEPQLEGTSRNKHGLDNGVGLVAEIDTSPPVGDGIRCAVEICKGALATAAAQVQDILTDRATADATPIPVLDLLTSVVDPAPAGYRVHDIPAEHVDAFGLQGITALSRPVLGYVLDPNATFSIPAVRLGALQETPMHYSHTVTYTDSGVFRLADFPGLIAVEVEVKGGSGSGAGAAQTGPGQHSGGGGGGGGEYRCARLAASELSAQTLVTVGAGGPGGVTGGANGTVSSFGDHVTAKGGIAGNHLPVTTSPVGMNAGGEGGYGGMGGWSIPGGAGAQYVGTPASACGGIGGSSHWGGGGRSSTTSLHTSGRAFGGGGAGAANSENQPAKTGGAGAPGAVRVHVYVAD